MLVDFSLALEREVRLGMLKLPHNAEKTPHGQVSVFNAGRRSSSLRESYYAPARGPIAIICLSEML